MSKFKMGDKVRVREDLVDGNYYNGVCFADGMNEYRGKVATISFIDSEGDYNLQGCGCWFFSDKMLEPTTKTEVEYDEKLKCYFISDGKRTLCFKDFGMSSTHPNDQYDEEIGKALAYKRFMEVNINE